MNQIGFDQNGGKRQRGGAEDGRGKRKSGGCGAEGREVPAPWIKNTHSYTKLHYFLAVMVPSASKCYDLQLSTGPPHLPFV